MTRAGADPVALSRAGAALHGAAGRGSARRTAPERVHEARQGASPVGLVRLPPHQPGLDRPGDESARPGLVGAARRRLMDGLTDDQYLETVRMLSRMAANLEHVEG